MKNIIIADDQIPEEKFKNKNDILKHYRKVWDKENNRWDDDLEFAGGFLFMKKLIGALRDNGYNTITVNKASDVIPTVKSVSPDCIILDLGWYNEYCLDFNKKMSLGWEIANEIQAFSPSIPIIMFSNRFPDDPHLAEIAAENHLLPIYKNEDENCIKNLLVALKYSITKEIEVSQIINEKRKKINFKIYKILCYVLLISVIISSAMIIGTFFLVINNKINIGIVTGLISAASTVINLIIYKNMQRFKK